MKTRCPNLSDAKVREEFNSVVVRLGGTELTAHDVANRTDYLQSLNDEGMSAYHRAYFYWNRMASVKAIMELLDSMDKLKSGIEQAQAREGKFAILSNGVSQHLSGVNDQIGGLTSAMQSAHEGIRQAHSGIGNLAGELQDMKKGLGAMVGMMTMPRRKASGFALKKDGGKTKAVVVSYDDGSKDEMPVE